MTKFLTRLWRTRGRALFSSRRANVAVAAGLMLPVMVGVGGLAVDAGIWQVQRNAMMGAADQAAVAAGLALGQGTNITTQARGVTAQLGFVNGVNGVSVTVNNPPASGSYSGNNNAVEVIVSKSAPLYFSGLFMSTSPTITERAVSTQVAAAAGNSGTCLMTFNSSGSDITTSGSTTLNMSSSCDIYDNSTSNPDLTMSGSGTITARNIYLSGPHYSLSGGTSISASGSVVYNASAAADPYGSYTIPSYSGCNLTSPTYTNVSHTFTASGTTPYVICQGLTGSGAPGTLTFNPGIYIFDRGSLNLSGGPWTISATGGVTLIFTTSTGSGVGTLILSGSTTLNVTAPSTGATAGIAVWLDKAYSNTLSTSGSTTWQIIGALYGPKTAITTTGATTSTCMQILAASFTTSGSSSVSHTCTGTGVRDVGNAQWKTVQ